MIELPQITLCTLGSDKYIIPHEKALAYSCREIRFGAVKNIVLPVHNIDDWNKAVIYELPKYIDTDFALLIHHDGYIINPDLWDPGWLAYDYVGAPWPLPTDDYSYRDRDNTLIRVGNSVSLRSKKLLNVAIEQKLEWKAFHGFTNEDGFICVNYRHEYLEAGCKFAPIEVAKYFSKEHTIPENEDIKTFAFHQI